MISARYFAAPPTPNLPENCENLCVVVVRETSDFRALAARLPGRGERVVDIGCAYGHATDIIARAVGDTTKVLGIDAGSEFVRVAKQNFPKLRFERLDCLEDLAFTAQLCRGATLIFIDIGGIRELAALVRIIPFCSDFQPRAIVVKSKRLFDILTSEKSSPSDFWSRVLEIEKAEGVAGRSRERRGGEQLKQRYPLRLPGHTALLCATPGQTAVDRTDSTA
ncbi:hypothetical protein CYMTET_23162 [Cymbomonas tetramitiformis]|uniref:Methyltransferase domain-containing protein n=1 Tax=Cymbomonas tetramitiformis TaxID=36881 RepID=A0AAE0FYY3_9CHLO|nr:hypothetical protein CYMTET_23162 [Cymbomonas tetramitiformis]